MPENSTMLDNNTMVDNSTAGSDSANSTSSHHIKDEIVEVKTDVENKVEEWKEGRSTGGAAGCAAQVQQREAAKKLHRNAK
jgi:hypothetical protein